MYQGPTYKRETNPRQNASVFSLITFFFTYKIFKKGLKKELEEEDIYDTLKEYRSTKLGDKFEAEWKKEESKKQPSLTRLIWRTYGKKYVLSGFIKLSMKTYFTIVHPICVGKIVAYFSVTSNDIPSYEAYLYAILLVVSLTTVITVHHSYRLYILQLALKARIAFCSLIYRKSLKLSSASIADITSGKIVTLMSKDVMILDEVVQFTNDIWIGVIQLFVMSYILYKQIGSAAFAGIGFLLLLSPLQIYLAKMTTKTKLKALARSDERVRIIQEVLSTIQIIKMYTWENYFTKLVNYVRKKEIEKIKVLYYLKVSILAIGKVSGKISFYLCIMTYTLIHGSITAEKAFVVLSCYGTIDEILNIGMPIGITQLAETKSVLKRIKKFLLSKEIKEMRNQCQELKAIPKIVTNKLTVDITRNVHILNDINLNLSTGLYGLTGAVGSGKSTLLKVFLQELSASSGYINVTGTVSYASQDPWLFPGTIRQNILFGLPYDASRYQTVISICGLSIDLDHFSKRDFTLVSDKGLNLSKGQQARVNLARAVYRQADIYMLDNPLAALDATVSRHVFKECIKGFLRKKLCILVTHQEQVLKQVDKIIVMKDGAIEGQGTFKELDQSGVSYQTGHVEDHTKDKCRDQLQLLTDGREEDTDERSALLQASNDIHNEAIKLYSEVKKKGKVLLRVYRTYFEYAGGHKTVYFLLLLLLCSQSSFSGFDYFISYWINVEEKLFTLGINGTNTTEYQDFVDKKSNIPLYYSALITAATLFNFASSFLTFILMAWANIKLHNMAFSHIIKAHMSFFDANLSGNILNRFSKDMHTLDEIIPAVVHQCLKILFSLFGLSFVMTTVKLEFIFITLAFITLLYVLKSLYLPTSRSLKRLDGVTRSPVIGHLNASLDGITTIRASGVQEVLKSQFDGHQDLHNSTAYMYLSTNRGFALWLDLLSVMYSAAIILGFFIFPGSTAGKVGLGLSQASGLSDVVQYGMRQWADFENQMTSVERVIEYTEVEGESKGGKRPADWPKKGKVSYQNVHLRYPKTKDLVLKDVSFAAEPREKIGIIGRTGAGKTSLVSSLFRLYDTEVGSITVDDCDIKEINLEHLRSNISIIPQNPVLFSGTLRSNLDPKDEYSDSDLWRALEEVEMKTVVSNLEAKLDCQMKEDDAVLSTGQKQLLCLARAVLRNNKIIVLDEATASIDPKTDELIQNTIRRIFSECTILTIAHKLNSVLDADKVMVLNNGSVSEFDEPSVLLNNQDSVFYYLVSRSGLLRK